MSNGTSSCPGVTLPFGLFADTPTIAPLDPKDFPPADPPPGLEQFILDNSPTDGSALDGFDLAFSEAVGIVDALDAALSGLGNDLLAAFSEADLIDPAPVGDTVAGFTASLDVSSSAVDNLGTLLGAASGPTPPGVGGGGGGGGTAGCELTLSFGVDDPVPQTRAAYFFNHTNGDVHVTSKVFTQDVAGVFSVSDTIPATMPASSHGVVNITRLRPAPLGTSCKFVITSDSPTSPNTLCGTVATFGSTAAPAAPTGGSITARAGTTLEL